MTNRVIFQNFDYHLMNFQEMEQFIEMREKMLVKQGFSEDDIFKIIFKDTTFISCFINEDVLIEFENKFKANRNDK